MSAPHYGRASWLRVMAAIEAHNVGGEPETTARTNL